MELYAEVRSKLEGRPFSIGEGQAVMRSTYVASSMEEARRDAEAAIMSSFTYNDQFRGRQVFTNPGEELAQDVKLDWDFLEPRTLLVGSPDNVVEKVQELLSGAQLVTWHIIAESRTPARVRPTRRPWLETALFTAMAVNPHSP